MNKQISLVKLDRSVDVVIVTKDKYNFLSKTVNLINSLIPYHRLIVVDSTENPDVKFLEDLNVEYILTPNAKLGFARQKGLLATCCQYVVYLDDDVIFSSNFVDALFPFLLSSPNVVAVSGNVIYGFKGDPVLFKLFSHSHQSVKLGHSGGFVLMKRDAILKAGGYYEHIHRGEDAELAYRLQKKGLMWLRCGNVVCYHPSTLKEMIVRNYYNGMGLRHLWLNGYVNLFAFFARLFGKTVLMPFYYFFWTGEPRIIVCYFLLNLSNLLGFGRGIKRND